MDVKTGTFGSSASVASSTYGQKLRLNVARFLDNQNVGGVLICVDEQSPITQLEQKVRTSLIKDRISGHLKYLSNQQGARLPSDEWAGDALRDQEEIIATLGPGSAEDEELRRRLSAAPPLPKTSPKPIMTTSHMMPDYVPGEHPRPPGPLECFERDGFASPNDLLCLAPKDGKTAVEASDWNVEGLTPKLREYITSRFAEVHDMGAEPGQAFLSITMKPRDHHPLGPSLTSQPIRYHVARIDIIEFERLCCRKVREMRSQVDYFVRCRDALLDLNNRGVALDDYAANTLPFRYRVENTVDNLLAEAEDASFGQVEGSRPVILLDPSGACGDHLLFVKEALKRTLYSFVVSKVRFNLIKCKAHGAQSMDPMLVPPTAHKLRQAEDWLDSVRPIRGSADLLEGLSQATASPDVDAVYVLTSGFPHRANTEAWIREIRTRNPRGVPLHIIGISCDQKAELELRHLAEANHGSFRQKRYDGPTALSSSAMRRSMAAGGSEGDSDDTRVTIGGQLSILEIMYKEQELQVNEWLDEQKCANRLLLTTCTQGVVPEFGQAQAAAQRTAQLHMAADKPPRLQKLLEDAAQHAYPAARGDARDVEVNLRRERQPDPPRSRARSQPHGVSAPDSRRPSLLNPWDRPNGAIRVSEMVSKSRAKGGAFNPIGPTAHGCADFRVGTAQTQAAPRRAAVISR
jgi:hypothetical protein